MKFGPRKPNIKKRVKARTTGKIKRAAKKSVNPTYGKKGTGWIKDPKRAAYNKAYNKTTTRIGRASKSKNNNHEDISDWNIDSNNQNNSSCGCGCWLLIIIVFMIIYLM